MEKDTEVVSSRRVAINSEIYTNVRGPYNLQRQLMYCQYCNFEIVTDLPGAQCKKCDSYLITPVRPNELA